MKLLIKKLDEKAVIPARQTEFSAGYDLSACCDEPITVRAGQTVKVHTGVSMEIDGDKNTVGLIYARSGLATKFGLAPANCVGVIDWDYRGEVIVALHNSSENDFEIKHKIFYFLVSFIHSLMPFFSCRSKFPTYIIFLLSL